VLFIAALTIFSFAQEDAEKAEKLSRDSAGIPSLFGSPKQTAHISPSVKPVIATKQQGQ